MFDSTAPQAGLYVIRLSETHYYGGRSKNVKKRCQKHLTLLRAGQHPNTYMQAVFNKYGQHFESELVTPEEDPTVLVLVEQSWLDQHFGQPGCVNISASAQYNPEYKQTCQTLSERAHARFSDPAERERMSRLQRGVPKSEGAKAKMSEVWKDTHHWSDELKARWGDQRRGQRRSDQARENISSGLKGHAVSEETRAKISAANKAYRERQKALKERDTLEDMGP